MASEEGEAEVIADTERVEKDEDELQDILEHAVVDQPSECYFCGRRAYTFADPDELDGDVPEDEGLIPVCDECFPNEDCPVCAVGDFCPEHMTPEEFAFKRVIEALGARFAEGDVDVEWVYDDEE